MSQQGKKWSNRLFTGKSVTFNFFVAYDLKLVIELVKLCEYSRSRLFLDLGGRSFLISNFNLN